MATVGEAKAAMAQANLLAGEAWGALESAREQLAAAMESANEAHLMAATAMDGNGHPSADAAVGWFSRAYAEIKEAYVKAETAGESLIAGQNNCTEYMGAF